MRIFIIADSRIPVPPVKYGGSERIIAMICDGLHARGHVVTLMASADSDIAGKVVPYSWAEGKSRLRRGLVKVEAFVKQLWFSRDADVVLACCRVDYLRPLLWRRMPVIYRFDNPIHQWQVDYLSRYARGRMCFVSVSDAQRAPIAEGRAEWSTIYNATPLAAQELKMQRVRSEEPYVAFLGLITYEKGIDLAIQAAELAGVRIKIGGIVPDNDHAKRFFARWVDPALNSGNAEWVGEVNDQDKVKLLSGAQGLIMPVRNYESFGIVLAESLAVGVPVVATPRGAIPEIVENGETGFLGESVEELAAGIRSLGWLSGSHCREQARARFVPDRMACEYETLIARCVEGRSGGGNA